MSNIANNLETTREMKDSGIKWMGEIPKEWSVVKYKTFSHNAMGETILKTDVTNDGIPIYSASKNGEVFGYIKSAKKILNYGDLVIPARGTIGTTHFITDEIATCTQTTICSKMKDVNKRFIYHCSCGLKEYWFEFTQTAVPQLTVEQVKNNLVPLPPLHEQQAIANYLDEQVGKIDELIAEQNQAIENWKAYKQSLITETVTKGLNPSVEMKDSEIEWIGEIPKDWGIRKVKDIFKIGRGRVISKLELVDDGIYPVFSSQTLNNGCLGYINTYDFDCKQLTWTTDGANAGEVFYREGKHNCTNVCGTLQLKNKLNSLKFHSYYLRFATQYYKRPDINGAKIMNNEMANILLLIPPLHEQQAIANYLDEKCSKIDQTIEQKQTLIKQLEEYKQSLIYECVTGKINVKWLE